jgi:hypothetical protein
MLELFGILIVSSPKTKIAKKASRLLQFHLLLRIHSLNLFRADQSSLAALTPRLRRVAHLALRLCATLDW